MPPSFAEHLWLGAILAWNNSVAFDSLNNTNTTGANLPTNTLFGVRTPARPRAKNLRRYSGSMTWLLVHFNETTSMQKLRDKLDASDYDDSDDEQEEEDDQEKRINIING